ncbi:MAG TPA: hypothetical protein IAA29_16235 [Candidatus Paenibacillus intestinavium]|nr:hypothetical protein [Candidatus Paenibacillus intestinavium]
MLKLYDYHFSIGGCPLTLLLAPPQNVNFQVYIFRMSVIKRYFTLDIIGGLAFYMVGRIAFGSELLGIGCNLVASQMLQFIVPIHSS